MSEVIKPEIITPRSLFDVAVAHSRYADPALVVYKEAHDAPIAINLIRGFGDFILTSANPVTEDQPEARALEKAVNSIKEIDRNDLRHTVNATTRSTRGWQERDSLWRSVFNYFALDLQANEQLRR